MRRIRLFLWSLALAMMCAQIFAADEPKKVTLNHRIVGQPAGTLTLRDGEKFVIEVVNTDKGCFTFNQTVVKASPSMPRLQGEVPESERTVSWEIIHSSDVGSYIIEATKKDEKPCNGLQLGNARWEIPVRTKGWQLAASGAFTTDKLTNPLFFAQKETNDKGEAGFVVKRDRDAEDKYRLGAAAMLHLYHDSFPFDVADGFGWVPVSFGLGVAEGSTARYYIGTSARFQRKLFLTVGTVFGSADRLPTGLREGDFITDNNRLNELGSKTNAKIFFALSFTFMDVDLGGFKGRFAASPPPTK